MTHILLPLSIFGAAWFLFHAPQFNDDAVVAVLPALPLIVHPAEDRGNRKARRASR